jgi:hypothetical protein
MIGILLVVFSVFTQTAFAGFPDESGSMLDRQRYQRPRFVRQGLAGATVIFDYRATTKKT